jgi:casein kinase I family protein HRR25
MLERRSLLPVGSIFEGLLVQNETVSKKSTFEIYKVNNLELNRVETLKLDRKGTKKLKNEFDIISQLKDIEFFPKVFMHSFEKSLDYLVYEGYYRTLDDLINENKCFDLVTTVSVYLQLLSGIEALHKKLIIHGNISPKSILINHLKTHLLLSGFTESIDLKSTSTYSLKSRNKNELSCSFASLSSHSGCYCLKDDLESLGYLLVYMHSGKLPWKRFFPKKTFSKWQKVYIMKKTHTTEQLCINCPKEFSLFFHYLSGVSEKDLIDYQYLKEIISRLIDPLKINNFLWDTKKKNNIKKKSLKKIQVNRMKSRNEKKRNLPAQRTKSTITRNELRLHESDSDVDFEKKGNTMDMADLGNPLKSVDNEKTLEDDELPAFKDRSVIMRSKEMFKLKLRKEQVFNIKSIKGCVLV